MYALNIVYPVHLCLSIEYASLFYWWRELNDDDDDDDAAAAADDDDELVRHREWRLTSSSLSSIELYVAAPDFIYFYPVH